MKDFLSTFNSMVKEARKHYFSDLILTNKHNPRFYLRLLTSWLIHLLPWFPLNQMLTVIRFLSYFNDKVESIRASVTCSASFSDVFYSQKEIFSQFYPITLPELLDVVSRTRVSASPLDVIPSRFLAQVIDSIGPILLSIVPKRGEISQILLDAVNLKGAVVNK